MISDEAVEAAAELIYRSSGRHRVMTYDEARANCHAEALVILEAAAPYLAAQAWDEGMGAMYESTSHEWPPIPEDNPYRRTEGEVV